MPRWATGSPGGRLRGLANVEFKRDARDGTLKLIECNVRFTAVNELIARSGIDLADFVYRRQLGQTVALPARARNDVCMWWPVQDTIACMITHRRGELSLRDWARAWPAPAPAHVRVARPGAICGRPVLDGRPRESQGAKTRRACTGPGSRGRGHLTGAFAMTSPSTVTIPAERLDHLLRRAFAGVGLDEGDAAAISEVLVDANLRGVIPMASSGRRSTSAGCTPDWPAGAARS